MKSKLVRKSFCLLLVVSLTFSLILSFSGCSLGKIVNDMTGGAVDVDKDGNIKIKGDEGEELLIGSTKWDKAKMHGLDAPKAKLDSSVTTEEGSMYFFSEMKANDAKSYMEKLKSEGFTYNSVTVDEYSYIGTNKNGLSVSFLYDKDNEGGTIVCGKTDPPSEEDNKSGEVAYGTERKWDSKEMGGLPDPGVIITSYSILGNTVTYYFEKFKDPDKYVEKIKAAGYTVDFSKSVLDDTVFYTANDDKGNEISFMASPDGGTITFTKND